MSADFWAGYISGATGIIIGNPLDLIKVRLQAGGASITASSPSSYANQFPSAGSLVRGATAPILGYGALNALLFMTYNRARLLLAGPGSTTSHPSLWTTWLAGAVGGLATWVVSTPTELVKCRTQAFSSSSPSPSPNGSAPNATTSFSLARAILRTEGIRGLYVGGLVTALRDSIGYGFYFWSYELSTRAFQGQSQAQLRSPPPSAASASASGTTIAAGSAETTTTTTTAAAAVRVLLCGGLAGVVTWASIFPLDVIKTRVQTQSLVGPLAQVSPVGISLGRGGESASLLGNNQQHQHQCPQQRIGALEMARRTYRNEGAAVFFRGLGVCSVRAFVVNAVQWAVYEWIMKTLGESG